MRVQLVGSEELLAVLNGPTLQNVPVAEWPQDAQELRDWFLMVATVAQRVMQETLVDVWFPEDNPQNLNRTHAYLDISVADDRSRVDAYRITYRHPEHTTAFHAYGNIGRDRVVNVALEETPLQ